MTVTAEHLFDRFAGAHRRGERPDPADAIWAAPEPQRAALATMIELYLAGQPPAPVAEVDLLARAADPRSAPPLDWPNLLPALREQTATLEGTLVRRLATALGFPQAIEQVEEHVHRLETGRLDPARVAPLVVSALAGIFGVADELLEYGRRLEPRTAAAGAQTVFARPSGPAGAPPASPPDPGRPERIAELDRLFGVTGG